MIEFKSSQVHYESKIDTLKKIPQARIYVLLNSMVHIEFSNTYLKFKEEGASMKQDPSSRNILNRFDQIYSYDGPDKLTHKITITQTQAL